MIPGKKYAPEDLLAILWKRKWLVVIPAILCSAGAFAYSWRLPNRYRSETTIYVQPPRVRPDLVRTTVTVKPEDRIQTITQQIMSRTRLEAIIVDFNLYPDQRRTGLMEDVVEQMRRDVSVKVRRGDAFGVSYESDAPVTAMKVTERLGRLFIDENLRDREMLAEGTSQFLGSQLDDARRRLVEQERKLEEYRRRHSGELPSQQQSNLTALSNVQIQIQTLVESMVRDHDRLEMLDRQETELTSPETKEEVASVEAPAGNAAGGTVAQRLEAARASLASMLLRLKADHPDITRMQRLIRDLEKQAEQEALQTPVSPDATKPPTQAELRVRRRLRQIQDDREQIKKNIAEKEAEEKRLRGVAAAYQARAEAAPTRETELIELTRDYDTLQKLYTNLLSKNEESKLAVNLETRQIGEQFRILDPARLPEKPFSPNRTWYNAMGLVGGLSFGLALILLIEWRDTTLKTEKDVGIVLGLPTLALIPVMFSASDVRRAKRRRIAVGLAGSLAVLIAAAAVAWVVMRA
jgi:polysaccharide chain length determinant protein (PEP-CTERM system associated)